MLELFSRVGSTRVTSASIVEIDGERQGGGVTEKVDEPSLELDEVGVKHKEGTVKCSVPMALSSLKSIAEFHETYI